MVSPPNSFKSWDLCDKNWVINCWAVFGCSTFQNGKRSWMAALCGYSRNHVNFFRPAKEKSKSERRKVEPLPMQSFWNYIMTHTYLLYHVASWGHYGGMILTIHDSWDEHLMSKPYYMKVALNHMKNHPTIWSPWYMIWYGYPMGYSIWIWLHKIYMITLVYYLVWISHGIFYMNMTT